MTIYSWELYISEIAKSLPNDGLIFQFFRFWTDYRESAWVAIPIILIVTYFIGVKSVVKPLGWTALAVVLADFVSRHIVKSFFMRPRPHFVDVACNASKCWGFVSSHSTNILAASVFLCLYDRRNLIWAIPVSMFVCASRIYLNDHFFLDVFGGAVLGTVIGAMIWLLHSQILAFLDTRMKSKEGV